MSAPWLKFWPRDWRGDQALRACSLAARGLWIEMIAIMHEAEPYGCLVLNDRPIPPAMLARQVGAEVAETEMLLSELEAAGVVRRKRTGILYSPRMVRDAVRARKGDENAAKRWRKPDENPSAAKCEAAENTEGIAAPNGSSAFYPLGPPEEQKAEGRIQRESCPAALQPDAAGARPPEPRPPPPAPQPAPTLPPIDFDRVKAALFAAGGAALDPTAVALEMLAEPRRWLAEGCDLEADIVPAVAALAGRIRAENAPPVRSWRYFAGAVADARARRLRPLPQGDPRVARPAFAGRRSAVAELAAALREEPAHDDLSGPARDDPRTHADGDRPVPRLPFQPDHGADDAA